MEIYSFFFTVYIYFTSVYLYFLFTYGNSSLKSFIWNFRDGYKLAIFRGRGHPLPPLCFSKFDRNYPFIYFFKIVEEWVFLCSGCYFIVWRKYLFIKYSHWWKYIVGCFVRLSHQCVLTFSTQSSYCCLRYFRVVILVYLLWMTYSGWPLGHS